MIPFTIALISLLPGNTWAYGICLSFVKTHITQPWTWPKFWLVIFLLWSFISCLLSPWKLDAFMGCNLRMEGFFMWIIMARLAWLYWEWAESEYPLLLSMLGVDIFLFVFFATWVAPAAVGGFNSVMACWSLAVSPWMAAFFAMIGMVSGMRSAWAAIAVGFFTYLLLKRKISKKLIVLMAIASIYVLYSSSVMLDKWSKTNIHSFGMGARTDWILQIEKFWKNEIYLEGDKIPGLRPLIGYGFESQGYLLVNPKKAMSPEGAPDRAHNVVYDLILQTGFVGFTLALLAFGSALGMTLKNRENAGKFSAIVAWIVYGFFNPQSAIAHTLMLTALCGIRSHEK